jgi:hypothetical protein
MKVTNHTQMISIKIGGGGTIIGSMKWFIEGVIGFLIPLKFIT